MFLILVFAIPHERPRKLTNACECLANTLGNVKNAYECLTNETTIQRMRGELHINRLAMLLSMVESIKSHVHAPKHGNRNGKFSLNMVNASCCSPTVTNIVANGHTITTNALQSLQMPCHQYEWLTIAYDNVAKTMRICYSPGT
jgi:hypothetical protein